MTAGKASHSGEDGERTTRLWRWILERWPDFVLWIGLLLFWFACINSEHLPLEALFVGPVLMLAGAIMIDRNKRETR